MPQVVQIVTILMAIFIQKEPRDRYAAYRFYCGSKYEQAHTASADARACWEVLQGQIKKYPDLPNTPDQLSAFVTRHRRHNYRRFECLRMVRKKQDGALVLLADGIKGCSF